MSNQPRNRAQTASDAARAAVAAKRPRTYEYTTLSAERPLVAASFDTYGADGWELVSVYVWKDAVHAVFKREAQ